MAQKLKEDLKIKIEQSALDTMLENGIDDCSMRSIAKKAGCTTGNLYRYFENKEQLIYSIIQPLMTRLDELISQETEGAVRLMKGNFEFPKAGTNQNPSEYFTSLLESRLYNVLTKLGEEGRKYPKRMKILINAKSVNNRLMDWGTELFKNLFFTCFSPEENYKEYVDTFISTFTQIFCDGILVLITKTENLPQDVYREMTKIYINIELTGIAKAIDKSIKNKLIIPNREVFDYEY